MINMAKQWKIKLNLIMLYLAKFGKTKIKFIIEAIHG
jgi:hypothetical protein